MTIAPGDTFVAVDRYEGNRVDVARIACDVDVASVRTIERYLDAATVDARALVVALEEAPYFDSSGIRLLARLHERFGTAFAVSARPGSRARRVLDLVAGRLGFRVCDGPDDACAYVVRAQGRDSV